MFWLWARIFKFQEFAFKFALLKRQLCRLVSFVDFVSVVYLDYMYLLKALDERKDRFNYVSFVVVVFSAANKNLYSIQNDTISVACNG